MRLMRPVERGIILMIRWSKITVQGRCLVPELNNNQIVDGMVDFEHSQIVTGDFVFFTIGNRNKIKKVLGLEKDAFELKDGRLMVNNYVRQIKENYQKRIRGYYNKVPEKCLLVGSNDSPDKFVEIVHYDNITRLIPKSEIPSTSL